MARKTDEYEVGYSKPPKHSRFKPGQSGNPKGRAKGTPNLKTDLSQELAERIRVREGAGVSDVELNARRERVVCVRDAHDVAYDF